VKLEVMTRAVCFVFVDVIYYPGRK
jgi:hypothetical protein